MNVMRDNVYDCIMIGFKRARFNPEVKLDLVFRDADGKGAADEGGPSRISPAANVSSISLQYLRNLIGKNAFNATLNVSYTFTPTKTHLFMAIYDLSKTFHFCMLCNVSFIYCLSSV